MGASSGREGASSIDGVFFALNQLHGSTARHCNGARLALYAVHCDLKESSATDLEQRRHCNVARLALHTVHYRLNQRRLCDIQQQWNCNGGRLTLHTVHRGLD